MPNITRTQGTRVGSTRPAAITAQSNDPQQRIRANGNNQFTLSGTATNSGFAPSELNVSLGARRVTIPLSRGMTPAKTFDALSRAMPRGYEARLIGAADHIGGPVIFEIRASGKPSTGALRSLQTPAEISASLEHKSLPSSSKLRKHMRELDVRYGDENIMNGVAGTISGKIDVSRKPSQADLDAWASALMKACVKRTDDVPLTHAIKVTNSAAGDREVFAAAKKFGTDGFVYDPSNPSNFRPLAKDMSKAIKSMGPGADVKLVTSSSKVRIDGSDGDSGGKTWDTTLALFVNLKTGEYGGFYSREGWV